MSANITLCSPRPSSQGDPTKPSLATSSLPSLEKVPINHVIIKVEKFGFSANNITYQALGEHPHFRYFDFHYIPASTGDKATKISPQTHGLIPVWGFGTVVGSTHSKIQIGERVYGYFAPSRYLLVPVSAADVNKYAFYVPRPHLPPDRRPYNQITRCGSDPLYTPTEEGEDLTMLYRPLFWTSYWCEDWLNTLKYTGIQGSADIVLLSSASSKTAFCLAYLLGKRRSLEYETNSLRTARRPIIVGLTSSKNLAFTQSLGLYDHVLTYDSFTSSSILQASPEKQWVYVDVAGNQNLNEQIRSHFGSPYTGRVVLSVELGMTNLSPSTSSPATSSGVSEGWSANLLDSPSSSSSSSSSSPSASIPSLYPPRTQFFMPEWLAIRRHQLTINEITSRQARAWKDLMKDCVSWVKLERVYGGQAVKNAYDKLAREGLGPDVGLIWSMWDLNVAADVKSRL